MKIVDIVDMIDIVDIFDIGDIIDIVDIIVLFLLNFQTEAIGGNSTKPLGRPGTGGALACPLTKQL